MEHVGTLLHEANHATFWHRRKDSAFKSIVEHGRRHYSGAPLRRGGTAGNAERLFEEAACEYVEHRGREYLGVYLRLEQILIDVQSGNQDLKSAKKDIRNLETVYNSRMGQRVFGYDPSSKDKTTRAISGEMKAFLDSRILEGGVPDRFRDSRDLMRLVSDIEKAAVQGAQQSSGSADSKGR